jgi:hypothetical protein
MSIYVVRFIQLCVLGLGMGKQTDHSFSSCMNYKLYCSLAYSISNPRGLFALYLHHYNRIRTNHFSIVNRSGDRCRCAIQRGTKKALFIHCSTALGSPDLELGKSLGFLHSTYLRPTELFSVSKLRRAVRPADTKYATIILTP